MIHWPTATLGDLTSRTRPICYGVLKPGPHVPGGVPLLRIVDIKANSVDPSEVHLISQELDAEFARSRLLGGEVLLSIQGTIGRVAICPQELAGANISRTIAVIDPDARIDKGFLRFYLLYLASAQRFEVTGTTRDSLNISTIRELEVPLPPLDEQQRIVAILEDHLGRVDISVESLRRALNYLETFRLALYGSAIRGAIGDLRFDVDAWPVATLDELQAPGQGSITDGPFGSNLKSSHYTSSGARVIRLQNIGLGDFLDAEAYISLEHFERLRKHEAMPGDLIVASLGDVLPRVCLLPDLGEPTVVKADCIRVRLGDQVRGRWVLMAMLTQQARQWAREQLHGVGRQRLGLKAIRSFEVPVPSISVQDEILARVDAVLSWSTSVELTLLDALRRSEGLRKSLLSAACSGQLTGESISV